MSKALSPPAAAAGARPRARASAVSPARLLARLGEAVAYVLVFGFMVIPILWIGLTAFKNERDAYTLNLFFEPTVANFQTIFSPPLNFGPLVVNSVIVGLATIAVSIPLALMAAYVFSRHVFVGSNVLLVWVLATQFIPPVVVAIPFFGLFRNLGLIDTLPALVILNLALVLPYAIWMLKGFVDTLPIEIEEAARIDGCSEVGVLRHVTFPLVIPGVIVTTVFAFMMCWNEFLFAFIMSRDAAKTVQIGLVNTVGVRGVHWEWMSAAGMIVMVPIFFLSLTIRRHFVQGFTMGAVK